MKSFTERIKSKAESFKLKTLSRVSNLVKLHWPYLIIIALAAFLTLPNLSKFGIPYGSGANDTAFHMVRMAGSAVRGFEDGQIVPQVDPAAIHGMGVGTNLFYGPMLTYLLPVLRILTFSWENAYILLIFIALLSAGIFMYKFSQELSGNKYISCIITALYLTTPYFLSDIYIRGAWGEIPTFTFMPMLFLGIHRALHSGKYAIILMWMAASGIILNHMLSIVIVFPFGLLYLIMNYKSINRQSVKRIILAAIIAIGITAFFWLPLIEVKMTGLYNVFNRPYLGQIPADGNIGVQKHGLSLTQYLFSDPLNGTNGVTQYYISAIALIGVVSYLIYIRKKPLTTRKSLRQIAAITLIAIILSLGTPLWLYVPSMLTNIQFPWRFCMVTTFGISIIAGYGIFWIIEKFIKKSNLKLATTLTAPLAIVIALPLLSAIYYSYPHTTFSRLYQEHQSAIDYFGKVFLPEYCPVVPCSDRDNSETCRYDNLEKEEVREISVTEGEADIDNIQSKGTHLSFDIDNKKENTIISIPRLYYPGYTAAISSGKDTSSLPIGYSKNYGTVEIKISKTGKYHVSIEYSNTTFTYIGLAISLTTLVSLAAVASITSLRRQQKQA